MRPARRAAQSGDALDRERDRGGFGGGEQGMWNVESLLSELAAAARLAPIVLSTEHTDYTERVQENVRTAGEGPVALQHGTCPERFRPPPLQQDGGSYGVVSP